MSWKWVSEKEDDDAGVCGVMGMCITDVGTEIRTAAAFSVLF